MKTYFLFKNMALRKVLHDYNISLKLDKYLIFFNFLKIFIVPFILFFVISVLLEKKFINASDLLIFLLIISFCSLLNFSRENYLIYEISETVPFFETKKFNIFFIRLVSIELCIKFIYIFFGFILPLTLFVNYTYLFISIPIFLILLGSISISIISYFLLFKKHIIKKNPVKYIYEYLSISLIAIIICFSIKLFVNIDAPSIFNFLKYNIHYFILLMVFLSSMSMIYLLSKIFFSLWDVEQFDIDSSMTLKRMNYLNKDLTLINRALNNKLALLKYIFFFQIAVITLGPMFLYNQFPMLNNKTLVYLIIIIVITNFSSDYLKKIISPNIDIGYLPYNIVEKINFSKLLIHKIPIFILINSISLFTVFLNIIIDEKDIIVLVILISLASILVINVELTSAFGSILYPKFELESEFEIGNSQKNMLLENAYLVINSVIISNLMFITNKHSFVTILFIYLIMNLLYFLIVILAFRNVKYSEVLENANY